MREIVERELLASEQKFKRDSKVTSSHVDAHEDKHEDGHESLSESDEDMDDIDISQIEKQIFSCEDDGK